MCLSESLSEVGVFSQPEVEEEQQTDEGSGGGGSVIGRGKDSIIEGRREVWGQGVRGGEIKIQMTAGAAAWRRRL